MRQQAYRLIAGNLALREKKRYVTPRYPAPFTSPPRMLGFHERGTHLELVIGTPDFIRIWPPFRADRWLFVSPNDRPLLCFVFLALQCGAEEGEDGVCEAQNKLYNNTQAKAKK